VKSLDDIRANAEKALNKEKSAAAEFVKMEITSFELKDDGSVVNKGTLKVSINPESYTRNFTDLHSPGKKKKADGQQVNAKIVEFRESVSFDLWFDGTGAIPGTRSVADDLNWLETNLVKYDGAVHATRYVKILWGTLQMEGQLTSYSVEHTYFNSKGQPLRAKAKLSFEEILDSDLKNKIRNTRSPDLTHSRVVRAGETLPMLCFMVYNDPGYYLKVAEANGLSSVMNIQPGQKIYFPPLR
jgi:nucleoid-associated protein YgaU